VACEENLGASLFQGKSVVFNRRNDLQADIADPRFACRSDPQTAAALPIK